MEPKQVIVITGASRGLGRAIALRLGQPQTAVLVNYLTRKEEAEKVVAELLAQGAEAEAFPADVQSAHEVQRMIKTVLSRWERIDLLIHNAGIRRDALVVKMTEREWDEVVQTHLNGAFHCLSAAAEPMRAHGGGHVILVGSIAALQGRAGQANYAAAKAGLIGLMQSAAREGGPWNIRVNIVMPGFQPTDMTRSLPAETRVAMIEQGLLGRPSSIEEVTGFISWLSGTRNISGQVFNLDNRIA
jgi:3-oxoacyl-[acyl-carrier protein] reductase